MRRFYIENLKILLYLSEYEIKRILTIFHEFIHTKDETSHASKLSKEEKNKIETEVNKKAEKILNKRSKIEDFV